MRLYNGMREDRGGGRIPISVCLLVGLLVGSRTPEAVRGSVALLRMGPTIPEGSRPSRAGMLSVWQGAKAVVLVSPDQPVS